MTVSERVFTCHLKGSPVFNTQQQLLTYVFVRTLRFTEEISSLIYLKVSYFVIKKEPSIINKYNSVQ